MITVIYTDDEPDLLEIGKLFLERTGRFSVDTAKSAGEALEKIQQTAYDAIISDYQMPGMNGIEFLKQVRASGNTIPFIIFTGRGREEIVIQALNEGADFYLQKGGDPIPQFAELAHKVGIAVQQRRAETSIRDHERREADIINFLPDATFAIDTNGVVIAWNRAMERMTGVFAGEIIGKDNYEYAIPFYHERRPILIDLVLREDPATASRYPLIKKEGNTLFSEITIPHFNGGRGASLWFTASPLYDIKGTIVGAIESIREITERKKAEAALQQSEQRYRNVVEDQTEFISRFRPDGTHVFVNEAYCRYFGLRREEILGHRFQPDIPPEDRDRVRRFFTTLTPDHPADIIEHRIVLPDGSIRWQRWSDRAIFDAYGTLLEYQSVGRDITEQKETDDALRESQQRNAAIIAALPDLLFVISRDGTYIDLQAADKNLLAVPPDRIIGKNIASAGFDPDIAAVILEAVSAAIDTGLLQHIEYTLAVPAGIHDFEARIVKLGYDRVLGIVRDITQQNAAEEALQESEERFRNLYDNMIAGVVVYEATPDGSDFIIRDINHAGEKIEHVKKDEVIGHRVTEIFPGVAEFGILDVFRQVAKTGVAARHPVSLYRDERIIGWRENYIYKLPSGEIVAIYEDLTEKKQAEEALQESRNLLDATERLAKVGGWEWDITRQTMTWTDETYRIHGFNPSEIAAGSLEHIQRSLACYDPADRPVIAAAFRACAEKGTPYDLEAPFTTADGRRIWVRTMARPELRDGHVVKVIGNVMEITERKQAEDQMIAAYAEYQNLLDNIQDVYYRTDAAGRLIRISRSMPATFGYGDISELLGKSVAEEFYFNPSDRNAVLQEISSKGNISNYEVRLKRKDGTPVWISANSHLWHNPDGSIGGVEGTFRDITEQKTISDALRRKTAELDYRNRVISTLLDTVPIGIFMVEATSGKPIVANKRATWLLGRGILPDATEENLAEVYEAYRAGTKERYPAKEMPVIRGMYGESSHIDDMEVVRPDGTRIRLEVFGTPVFDSQGRVAASLVCFLDITDRKQTEEMIHRLAQFPEQNPLPVLRIAGDGTLIYANNPGKQWLAGFPGHRQEQVPEILGALVTDTIEKQGIRTLEVQDESGRVSVATATRPIGEDFVNIYVSDITERKKAERIIIETNRKINLLATITRHDVANQVTILQAFAQIALEHNPDPAIAGLLEKIKAAGTVISRQIEFTRAYQELGMQAPDWYAVRDLVLRHTPAGITITCTCDAEVYADPMLEKVFFNLIDNAARHGERVTDIAVRCEKSGADCVVTVEDNGVGVPPELKEKIFEKGYGKHTGFGLFLAREILAITGISIRENGIFGMGATFELRVPAGGFRVSSTGIPEPEP